MPPAFPGTGSCRVRPSARWCETWCCGAHRRSMWPRWISSGSHPVTLGASTTWSDMAENIDRQFLDTIGELTAADRRDPSLSLPGSILTGKRCLELFDSQLGSRHLDLVARQLGAAGIGYYTIGSSGHEGNAALAAALRPTDPALLHYRSGAFYLERARQVPEGTPLPDGFLGLVAAA